MPRPTQYRNIQYTIAGRNVDVAGMARPGFRQTQTENVVAEYLVQNRYDTLVSLEDPEKNKNLRKTLQNTTNVEYIENYATKDFTPPSNATLKEIFKLVKNNALLGKKTAIHCAAGLGRTGTVLAALKIKEQLLQMPSDALTNKLNEKTSKVTLGQHSEFFDRKCTPIVKKAIEEVRSSGGSYNNDYVENEEQIDRLCEYQAITINDILQERQQLDKACAECNIPAINSLIEQGASPTNEMFLKAYAAGDINVMNALINGGIMPTHDMCRNVTKPQSAEAILFAEIAILSSELENKLSKFMRLQPTQQNDQALKELRTILASLREYRSSWSNTNIPAQEKLGNIINTLDNAVISDKAITMHRGIINTTPALREAITAVSAPIKAISLIFKKIYRYMQNDKKPVYEHGLSEIFKPSTTDTAQKIKSLRANLQQLREDNVTPKTDESITESKKGLK